MSSSLCTMRGREIITVRNRAVSRFGTKLKERIDSDWVDVKTFAAKSGIPAPNVYRWIAGARPTPASAIRVAKALGDEPAVWMRLAGYPAGDRTDPIEQEQDWLTLVRSFPWLQDLVPDILNLTPENQGIIRDLVKRMGRQGQGEAQ